ncbi:division/outer membrane stress-associated lipid-binding lipoprotein [Gallibacterium anatis]|uniref:Osmotically-inducible protein Y n=2 Tax=Gallibacterium anatis TaxID=750 RepID=A0A263HGY4_9PAST|nr:division/outer membrane stress-associated lipid-binding lipoprotein [Gallibacterium anatis]UZD16683.1 division/outer membrane stress-associated lipid-binding lipoprotein [Gallibacterium anatis]WAX72277.1 division/outer membrane stress-associated lipid-binding lipoprotein [Gallibacterium anatis]WIM83048.1 division/outer membrane stress-associated lipid-binding lipoprotein [Gallibacterium anatis]STO37722.1 Osmotically-inducible protein Y precursor [Gallibacterium anatis]
MRNLQWKQLVKVTAMAGVVALLQGCVAAAVVGGGALATKVAMDPRTTGTQIDDQTLELRVADALRKDKQLNEQAHISAVVYNGRALLVGEAPSADLKEVAVNLARGVKDIADVYDEIQIGEKVSFMQASKDTWITTEVKSKLFVNGNVKASDVKVVTENGVVYLIGRVTQSQAAAAVDVARQVNGVRKVVKVFTYLN